MNGDAEEITQSLCCLDALPPKCSLEAEVGKDTVRFRVTNGHGQPSLWSGWFSLADAPISLVWTAFEWP